MARLTTRLLVPVNTKNTKTVIEVKFRSRRNGLSGKLLIKEPVLWIETISYFSFDGITHSNWAQPG